MIAENIAADLLRKHGSRASQVAVDQMVLAIRESNLPLAFEWEAVAVALDKALDIVRPSALITEI